MVATLTRYGGFLSREETEDFFPFLNIASITERVMKGGWFFGHTGKLSRSREIIGIGRRSLLYRSSTTRAAPNGVDTRALLALELANSSRSYC